MNYAGFFRRLGAFIIDCFVFLFLFIFFGIMIGMMEEMSNNFIIRILSRDLKLFSIILTWLYYAVMESSHHQGTVGKILLKIKVVSINGDRIDFFKATLRYFARYISGFIMMIGFLMPLFTEKKQALHDMIANCVIIHSP